MKHLKRKFLLVFVVLTLSALGHASIAKGQKSGIHLFPQVCQIDSADRHYSPWNRVSFIFLVEENTQAIMVDHSLLAADWNRDYFPEGTRVPRSSSLYISFENTPMNGVDHAFSPLNQPADLSQNRLVGELEEVELPQHGGHIEYIEMHFLSGSHELEINFHIDGTIFSTRWICNKSNPYSAMFAER